MGSGLIPLRRNTRVAIRKWPSDDHQNLKTTGEKSAFFVSLRDEDRIVPAKTGASQWYQGFQGFLQAF